MDDLLVFAITLLLIYGIVIAIRYTGTFKKDKCPVCTGRLMRKNKSLGDRIIIGSTLGILPFNRYKCTHCSWEGLRWSPKSEKSNGKHKSHKHRRRRSASPSTSVED